MGGPWTLLARPGQSGEGRGGIAVRVEPLHHGELPPFCSARLRNEAAAVIYAIN